MISIIIPIYNRAYCLPRCLDSVINQTFTNWQCILIDDGSTDETLSVCRHYVELDSRFSVYSQSNSGVSAARNQGIEHAEGEYVAFIDSDDWVEPDYLQLLYEAAGNNTMPLCGYFVHFLNGSDAVFAVQDVLYKMENNVADLIIEHLFDGLLAGPVCKLFDRNIIETHHIRFPENISWGEDLIFNYTYFEYIDKIKGVSSSLYHVIKQNNSLTTNAKYDFFLTDISKKLWQSVSLFLHKKSISNPDLDALMAWYYAILLFKQIKGVMYVHDRLSFKERYERMREIVANADRKEFVKIKSITIKLKTLPIYFKASFLLFLFYEISYIFQLIKK